MKAAYAVTPATPTTDKTIARAAKPPTSSVRNRGSVVESATTRSIVLISEMGIAESLSLERCRRSSKEFRAPRRCSSTVEAFDTTSNPAEDLVRNRRNLRRNLANAQDVVALRALTKLERVGFAETGVLHEPDRSAASFWKTFGQPWALALQNAGATFTIQPRPASWTTNNNSKIYGDADPSPLTTGSGIGFLAADQVTADYTRFLGENANRGLGFFPIKAFLYSPTLSSEQLAANYAITNSTGASLLINSATLAGDAATVTLTTGTQTEGITYTIVINGIRDRSSASNLR